MLCVRVWVPCVYVFQGEHIHLGYYTEQDRKAVTIPWKSGKVFKETKFRCTCVRTHARAY